MRSHPAPVGDLFATVPAPKPAPPPAPQAEPVWPPVCLTCGGPGVFGFGVFRREGREGEWFCQKHKGNAL